MTPLPLTCAPPSRCPASVEIGRHCCSHVTCPSIGPNVGDRACWARDPGRCGSPSDTRSSLDTGWRRADVGRTALKAVSQGARHAGPAHQRLVHSRPRWWLRGLQPSGTPPAPSGIQSKALHLAHAAPVFSETPPTPKRCTLPMLPHSEGASAVVMTLASPVSSQWARRHADALSRHAGLLFHGVRAR